MDTNTLQELEQRVARLTKAGPKLEVRDDPAMQGPAKSWEFVPERNDIGQIVRILATRLE
jgi:hypothetical protein